MERLRRAAAALLVVVSLLGAYGLARAQGPERVFLPSLANFGPPGSCEIYPLGVWSGFISQDEFLDPGTDPPGDPPAMWRRIEEGRFAGYTARRVYVENNGFMPGGFVYLRWTSDSSTEALVEALEPPGNIEQGFTEAPWPDGWPNLPPAYPGLPGELSPGDWVDGRTGVIDSPELSAVLEGHIASQRLLALPFFDEAFGMGQSGTFSIVRLGLFALLDAGGEQGVEYLDMVYLGGLPNASCPGVPFPTPTPPPPNPELDGSVEFQPEYPQITDDGGGNVTCTVIEEAWKDTMFANEFTPVGDFSYPTRIGQVFMENAVTGVSLAASIFADTNGKLKFSLANIPAGTYQLAAFIYYRHPLDPEPMPRVYGLIYENEQTVEFTTLIIEPGNNAYTLRLKTAGPICTAP